MDSTLWVCCISTSLIVLFLFFKINANQSLNSIPIIGPSGTFSSYIGAYNFMHHSKEMVQEGFDKNRHDMFRVPFLWRWVVIVSGPKLIDDIRFANEDELSMQDAGNEMTLQTDYTLGRAIRADPYHVKTVHSGLTRNIGPLFPEIHNELSVAFTDAIVLNGRDWKPLHALDLIRRVVCRTSNRLFVGLPLCRNNDYENLILQFAMGIHLAASRITMFPKFLWPIVGKILSPLGRTMARANKYLGPLIAERLRLEDLHGKNWPERPNDLISWLLDQAKDDKSRKTVHDLTLRILFINFVSIHTSANSFAHALYHLAEHPEYIQPIRIEVETSLAENGWTKEAFSKMHKVDSFIRESQRVNGLASIGMERVVSKPDGFRFSNGVVLPKGTYVAVASFATHHDKAAYTNPESFDGFRFVETGLDGKDIKRPMTSTDSDYVAFGHGKLACPGRFFAANTMKAMMAYIVLNYDVKFEGNGRPPNVWSGYICLPHPDAMIYFRKRRVD